MTHWSISARERMLRALAHVLSDITGVRTVERQAIESKMVTEAQMPAILIDEVTTRYRWGGSRPGDRTLSLVAVLGIEVQIQTRRGPRASVNESTVREAFVEEVLQTLVDNPQLRCQLDDEDAPVAHCRDCARQFDVRYIPGPGNFARALITASTELEAIYDRRPRTEWQRILLTLYPTDDSGAEPEYVPETDLTT